MGAIRGTLQSDSALRAAAVAELAQRRPADATDLALAGIAGSVRGLEQPVSEFLWTGARDSNACRTTARSRVRAKSTWPAKWCSSACRSRGSREQQDDFYSVFSAEHRHQSERCRGRCDRCRESPRATHVAAVAAAVSRRARRAARHRVRFASSAGSAWRARPASRWASAALYCSVAYVAVHELRRSGCRWSCRCSCSCPLGFGVAIWWNYREVAVQRERVRTALGYYVPKSVARRLTRRRPCLPAPNRRAVARHVPRHRCRALHVGQRNVCRPWISRRS